MGGYHNSKWKHRHPDSGGPKKEETRPITQKTNHTGVDTSLFVSVILGILALIGVLLQWNGVIAVRWAWSLPMYVVLCISAVYVFWRWETAQNWKMANRYVGVLIVALVFAAISSVGVVTQYKRENPHRRDIREEVATWLSHTNWQFKPMDATDPGFQKFIANTAVFAFGVTFPSGMHVVVFQGTVHPDFLQIKSIVPCPDDDLSRVNALSFDQTSDLFE